MDVHRATKKRPMEVFRNRAGIMNSNYKMMVEQERVEEDLVEVKEEPVDGNTIVEREYPVLNLEAEPELSEDESEDDDDDDDVEFVVAPAATNENFVVDPKYHQKYLTQMNKGAQVHGIKYAVNDQVYLRRDFNMKTTLKNEKFEPIWYPEIFIVTEVVSDITVKIKNLIRPFQYEVSTHFIKKVHFRNQIITVE